MTIFKTFSDIDFCGNTWTGVDLKLALYLINEHPSCLFMKKSGSVSFSFSIRMTTTTKSSPYVAALTLIIFLTYSNKEAFSYDDCSGGMWKCGDTCL